MRGSESASPPSAWRSHFVQSGTRLLALFKPVFTWMCENHSIMSWDIFVQDFPQEAKTVTDIPMDFRPRSLGKRSAIIERIRAVVPAADFSDPSWGVIDGDGWSIEVSMGDEQECRSFVFHVRGGDGSVGAVEAILRDLGLRAMNSETGDFFVSGSAALDSFRKWRAYRDQVAGENSA
jgi:hypothetical protein